MTTDYKIPREEVKKMKPQDFIGTYTYYLCGLGRRWIQYNEGVNESGDLGGLAVFSDGDVMRQGGWCYDYRCDEDCKHYKSLEDLVECCPDKELLNLFLKEHCQ